MGETISRTVQPEPLAVFKGISGGPPVQSVNIPELDQNRKLTDLPFLIAFVVTVVLLMPLLIYTLYHSDVYRIVFSYDECGNVCGTKNHHYAEYACSGKDFRSAKNLQYDSEIKPGKYGHLITPRRCVAKCKTGYEPRFYICEKVDSEKGTQSEKPESFIEQLEKQEAKILTILIASFLSIAVVIIIFFLFRSFTAAVFWSSLVVSIICLAVFGGLFVYYYLTFDSRLVVKQAQLFKWSFLIMSVVILMNLFSICYLTMTCFKRIRYVIQLLKEAVTAIKDMPLLLCIPLSLFFAVITILASIMGTTFLMFGFGVLKPLQDDYLYYGYNAVFYITMVFNIYTAFWALQFVIGIHHMVIAGAVAKWYFSRDKKNLGEPILTSMIIVFKFHLGSIALGSPFIVIFFIFRQMFEALAESKQGKGCIDSCMPKVEAFFKSMSKNSYVLTAMHGQPFYKSGKRAAKIIFTNPLSIITIQNVVTIILSVMRVVTISISILITAAVLKGATDLESWPIYGIVFTMTLCAGRCIFGIFETTVNTIFLCFCEDSLMNDGMTRPYAMSTNLSEFIEKWKTDYGVREE